MWLRHRNSVLIETIVQILLPHRTASGFYDWTVEPGCKQPHLFTPADGSPLGLGQALGAGAKPETGDAVGG
jgi:hypothetical protein